MIKTALKNNAKFIAIFAAAMIIFHWKLIVMKASFLGGDSLTQFYPWFKIYAESLEEFRLPFWTRYMQSGFPLMAEGQVGGYYPFNLVFFFLLPFNVAYNYSIIFHFLVAGISVYLLARRLGACELGGTVSALIFCFGSAYAGCFYNIVTLRTLCWTPLVFLLLEKYLENKKAVYMLWAAVIFGMQLLAGFVQLAFYAWIFYLAYFIYRARSLRRIAYFLVFAAISLVIFLPQLLLTYRLILQSSRTGTDIQFALWGSFNPLLLIGLVFPYLSFTLSNFYLGIYGLLFLIASFYLLRSDKRVRAVFLILALSFFLSLGSYNPFYVLFLKLTGFYTFRNPSKFLFFTAFAASVLAGRGFTEFCKNSFPARTNTLKIYAALLVLCSAVFLAAKAVVSLFKDLIIKAGEWYAASFVYGRPTHRYDLDTYIAKVHKLYRLMVETVSFANFFNIAAWVLLISAIVLSVFAIKRKGLRMSFNVKLAVIAVIVLDLFIYGYVGKDVRTDIRGFDRLNPTHPGIMSRIKNDHSLFRVLPYGIGTKKLPSWIMPNTNIIYGIDSVAAYTPLADGNYKKALSSLEIIDDSLGVRPPREGSLDDGLGLIRALNVKYVVSAEKLEKPYLDRVMEEDGAYLYRLSGSLPRGFVSRNLDIQGIDGNAAVKMIEYTDGKAEFLVEMPYDGYFVLSENRYPGWKAHVDGRRARVLPFSVIMAVELKKGAHSIRFAYKPY